MNAQTAPSWSTGQELEFAIDQMGSVVRAGQRVCARREGDHVAFVVEAIFRDRGNGYVQVAVEREDGKPMGNAEAPYSGFLAADTLHKPDDEQIQGWCPS